MSQEPIKKPLIEVSAKQAEFLKHKIHSWNILSGVTRSGKSHVQIMKWFDFMYNIAEPHSIHLMSGKTTDSLKYNLLEPILSMDNSHDIVLKGKPEVLYIKSRDIKCRCVGCDNEQATARVQGGSVSSWWSDEIVKHPWTFIEMASSRCSEGGIIRPKFATCNPDTPSHRFKTDIMDSQDIDVKNWFFGFPDNPVLTEYLVNELKKTYTGVFYDRMILGLWTVAEGIVYKMFDQSIHVVSRDKVPWKRIERYVMGLDWGYTHSMGATLYAIESDGTWWQIDEFKETGRQVDQKLVDDFKAKGWMELPLWRFDGAYWKEYKVMPDVAYGDCARPEYIELFGKLSGITTRPAIKPDKPVLINAVMRKYNPDANGKSGLYHTDNCRKTIAEKMSYRWKEGSQDQVVKENDELVDCEQYAIYTHEAGKVTRIRR